jgi:hypothetical protein
MKPALFDDRNDNGNGNDNDIRASVCTKSHHSRDG